MLDPFLSAIAEIIEHRRGYSDASHRAPQPPACIARHSIQTLSSRRHRTSRLGSAGAADETRSTSTLEATPTLLRAQRRTVQSPTLDGGRILCETQRCHIQADPACRFVPLKHAAVASSDAVTRSLSHNFCRLLARVEQQTTTAVGARRLVHVAGNTYAGGNRTDNHRFKKPMV